MGMYSVSYGEIFFFLGVGAELFVLFVHIIFVIVFITMVTVIVSHLVSVLFK